MKAVHLKQNTEYLGFIQDLPEDCSLGDSSEELLQKGRGEASVYLNLGAGKNVSSSIHLGNCSQLVTKNRYTKLMILELFLSMTDAEVWVIEILPELCILGPDYPKHRVPHPEFLSGCTVGGRLQQVVTENPCTIK